jgi:hypothetical protein
MNEPRPTIAELMVLLLKGEPGLPAGAFDEFVALSSLPKKAPNLDGQEFAPPEVSPEVMGVVMEAIKDVSATNAKRVKAMEAIPPSDKEIQLAELRLLIRESSNTLDELCDFTVEHIQE